MRHALAFPLVFSLSACAAGNARTAPERAPVWRCRVKPQSDGSRIAVAVDELSGRKKTLPQGLWCPHGAIIELKRDATGRVVDAESKVEPLGWIGRGMAGGFLLSDGLSGKQLIVEQAYGEWFALPPAADQVHPWVVLKTVFKDGRSDFAILERRPEGLRVTPLGPWKVEHLGFQRMERPGPGLENCVLLAVQAGEGTQVCVVKIEVGAQGARLRPRTDEDAAILRHFLGRATPAEKAVVEKVLAP